MDKKPDYYLHTLANGIRWVHKEVKHTKISHIGIMLDIGSRDEMENEQGLAHFWEHMAFKGTKTKKSSYILQRIDSLGGELNAYTTKEKICFHASLLSKHTEKAIELLSDITFNSIFPEKEIEKERQVILEEMSMYDDNPEDAIQDQFDEVIFKNHALGKNILGTKESVSNFKREHFLTFIANNLSTKRLVISTVGNFSQKKGEKWIQKYLGGIELIHNERKRTHFENYLTEFKYQTKPISQAHCMMGTTAYPLNHTNRIAFFVLSNLLGGPAMNARLNLAIREKYGLVYSIDCHFAPYTDTGLFSIYFGTEKKQIKKATHLVLAELKKLREILLTNAQLKAVKEQIKGQLAMSEENNNGMMLTMAKSILDFGHIETLEEIFDKINHLTSTELQNVAKDIFQEENISYLIFQP
jgi:predicted Zn-dependent peptidase